MQTDKIIETERMVLRRWTFNDIDILAEIFGDRQVMRFFPNVLSREQTEAFINKMNNQIDTRSYGYFAVELQKDKTLIGFTGLSFQEYVAPFTPCVDIGWRIMPDYWGQGLATEAAHACLGYGFRNKSITKIFSIAPEVNKASIAVMKKLGMVHEYNFDHPALLQSSHLNPCVLYSIDKISYEH